MSTELALFNKVLLAVWERNKYWKNYGGPLSRIYTELFPIYEVVHTDSALKDLLPSDSNVYVDFWEKRKFIYLDPPQRESSAVPVLSLQCNFGCSIPMVSLKLALYLLDERRDLRAIGFRFESPGGPGLHHYYHIQLINGFMRDAPFYRGHDQSVADSTALSWLPVTQPALPVGADKPVKLLLSLLISLYGVKYVGDLQINNSVLENQLTDYLREMRHELDEPIVCYWKVVRSGYKSCYAYETDKQEKQFREYCGRVHQNHELTRITQSNFINSSCIKKKY